MEAMDEGKEKLLSIRWTGNNSSRYDGRRSDVSVSSVVRVNGQQFAGDATQITDGDEIDMIFNKHVKKVKTWHGVVISQDEEDEDLSKQPRDSPRNGGGELGCSLFVLCANFHLRTKVLVV